jgi:UDPglucose--hexose-1-phosphate uridylyltransferase
VIAQRPPPADAPAGRPWQTRVAPNKFAALVPDAPAPPASDALHRRAPAAGRQEVVIDHPRHDVDLPDLPVPDVEAVLATYQARCRAVRAEAAGLHPFVFRNHGPAAGASLAHPHSQLIATRHAPDAVQAEEARQQGYFDATGACLVCALAARAASDGRRVHATDGAVAFVPFAAAGPCELLLVPRPHTAAFADVPAASRRALARLLRDALRAVRRVAGRVPYNLVVRTPLRAGPAPHLHAYLRLVPRLTVQAGFELSTGVRVNPAHPAADAARLRDAWPSA